MKAKICSNLREVIETFHNQVFIGAEGDNLQELSDRISGKIVDLVFIGNDAFEKEDNNWWIPTHAYEKIQPVNEADQR